MMNLRHILKDHHESGAFHALVNVQAVVGDGVFLTKSGDLVTIMAVRGPDSECLDAAQTHHVARRFEAALHHFGERFRLYQYVHKCMHPALPGTHYANPIVEEACAMRRDHLQHRPQKLYNIESYFAVVYEGWRPAENRAARLVPWFTEPRRALRDFLSSGQTLAHFSAELDLARELLTNKVASLAIQLRDVLDIEPLGSARGFQFLRQLLNYSPHKADGMRLKYPNFVDYQVAGSSLECHREFLRLDDYYVSVLTLKEPPARTFANILRGLNEIPSQMWVVTEWRAENALKVRRVIRSKQRHFFNSKSSLTSYLNTNGSGSPQDMLIDDGAAAMVANLGASLEEMQLQGHYFGEFSLTIILYDEEPAALRRSIAHCFKVFANDDAQLTEERFNRLNAWIAALPGNSAHNLRRVWLLNTNYADLSLLFTPASGHRHNDQLNAEYLAILEGNAGVPYFFNLHYKDVAHTLVLGTTGSGKSFLLNFVVMQAQKYAPITFIFDLGGSYESTTRLFDGSYLRVGAPEQSIKINPFSLPPTPENIRFLFSFVKVLTETNGFRLMAEDEKDLYEQIENLYAVAPAQRRLSTLASIVRRPLRAQLQKWIEGGPHAALFDHADDELSFARFQTFDFEGMEKTADQLEPLLFYIFHRANAVLYDPTRAADFKLFIVDEAWRFLRHPAIKAYFVEALKTWRKKNAAIVLATQSSEDLLASDLLPTVVESCPTKLFLANPGMDRQAYRDAFHLNDTEADLIATLIPKQQILIKQPDQSKLVNLNVDRKGYWLYTNNPQDNRRKREAFARHGFAQGLEELAKEMK